MIFTVYFGVVSGGKGEVMTEKGTVVADRYEVIRPIGEGGTSRVYLVRDRHIGRTLAMKVMEGSTTGALKFARSEIESLRCVRYPAFPAIHDAFALGSCIYIVSEYVQGTPLWKIIRGKGMPRDRALALTGHICDALSYLHGMKPPILYLDLKPDNIIMDEEGMPHLIDFGIAGRLAGARIPVGTIGYSPPEQYRTDAAMDVTSDIFALGMTYYAVRSGVPPDRDISATLDHIKHSRTFNKTEQSFLTGCCAFRKEERFQDTLEVSRQIRHIRTFPDKLRKRIAFAVITAGSAVMLGMAAKDAIDKTGRNKAAAELVSRVTGCMEDGEYTPEAIGIIKAYIAGGMLPPDTEQEFIFEAAVGSMMVMHDYNNAAYYFAKLDPKKYPQAEDYMELCRIHGSFDYDAGRALQVTGRLFADVAVSPPSKTKYENMIFIAQCYELYEPDAHEGTVKALSVLDMAAKEIEECGDDSLSDIRARIDGMSAVKRKKLRIRRSENKMIGETDEDDKTDK